MVTSRAFLCICTFNYSSPQKGFICDAENQHLVQLHFDFDAGIETEKKKFKCDVSKWGSDQIDMKAFSHLTSLVFRKQVNRPTNHRQPINPNNKQSKQPVTCVPLHVHRACMGSCQPLLASCPVCHGWRCLGTNWQEDCKVCLTKRHNLSICDCSIYLTISSPVCGAKKYTNVYGPPKIQKQQHGDRAEGNRLSNS